VTQDQELEAFAEKAREVRDRWRHAWRAADKPRFRQAWWPERFVRNYLNYRRTLPKAGTWAAVRWALQDPVLPYLVKKMTAHHGHRTSCGRHATRFSRSAGAAQKARQ
jgi:hypothetical protein